MIFLSKNIKILRKLNNLNQTELAQKLNITRDSIASLENERMKPSFEMLIKLRNELKINLDDLIFKDLSKEDDNS